MFEIAQTHLQLYEQMLREHYAEPEIARVRDAYALAMRLVSGQYRPSGKPFVCHLVGTASVLVRTRASADLVVAGLLHAAYLFGDFGSGVAGEGPGKRKLVREVAGAGAEALASDYGRFVWSETVIADFESRATRLSPNERDLLALRLANDVDDHADGGMRLSGHYALDGFYASVDGARAVRLAERAGLEALAAIVAASRASCGPHPAEALLRRNETYSFALPAASQCTRPSVRVRRRLRRLARSLAERVRRLPAGDE